MLSGILALVSFIAGGLMGFCVGFYFRHLPSNREAPAALGSVFNRKVQKNKPKAFSDQDLWEREQEVKKRGGRLDGSI